MSAIQTVITIVESDNTVFNDEDIWWENINDFARENVWNLIYNACIAEIYKLQGYEVSGISKSDCMTNEMMFSSSLYINEHD